MTPGRKTALADIGPPLTRTLPPLGTTRWRRGAQAQGGNWLGYSFAADPLVTRNHESAVSRGERRERRLHE